MNGAKKDTIEKAFAKRIADIPTVSATMDVYKSTLGVLKACTAIYNELCDFLGNAVFFFCLFCSDPLKKKEAIFWKTR